MGISLTDVPPAGSNPLVCNVLSANVAPTNPPKVIVGISEAIVGTSKPAPADISHSSKKKKRSKEGDKSFSKRSRRDSPPQPLSGGLLDLSFSVSDRMNFRMSSAEREVVEQLSEREIVKASLELTGRGAMLMWYAEGFADQRGLEEIQKELVVEKKAASDAKANLEALTLEHSKCESEQTGLKKKLKDACVEVVMLTKRLQDLGLKYQAEKEETARQGADLRQAREKIKNQEEELVELHSENIRLEGKLHKETEDIDRLNQDVQLEHEEGFFKAIPQAAYFFKFDPTTVGFDLGQDVYSGTMKPIPTPVGEEEGPVTVQVEGGAGGQVGHEDDEAGKVDGR